MLLFSQAKEAAGTQGPKPPPQYFQGGGGGGAKVLQRYLPRPHPLPHPPHKKELSYPPSEICVDSFVALNFKRIQTKKGLKLCYVQLTISKFSKTNSKKKDFKLCIFRSITSKCSWNPRTQLNYFNSEYCVFKNVASPLI